ncbi:MAG: hypothetical protein H0W88_11580 [Parachlamydiaceae bacterium]|nr:hypothetical protein [Parachlamydiaceae bacterium]
MNISKVAAVPAIVSTNPVLSKLSDKHKIVMRLVLAALAIFSIAYVCIRNWSKGILVKPVLEGTFNGEINYNPLTTLKIESTGLKLSEKGLFTGKAIVALNKITYNGRFVDSRFEEGFIQCYFGKSMYFLNIKNFKIVAAERNYNGGEPLLDGMDIQEALEKRDALIVAPKFDMSNFSYTGTFKGEAFYNKKPVKIASNKLELNSKGEIDGVGNLEVLGTAHEGQLEKIHHLNGSLKGAVILSPKVGVVAKKILDVKM